MTWLLQLYPRAWRRRYGEEVEALLASEPRSFRLFLDLIAGAIDAWLNPQVPAGASPSGDKAMMKTLLPLCSRPRLSRQEVKQGAAWMIGGSLGFIGIAIVLQLAFGQTILSQTLIYSAYPLALILSGRSTCLRHYPPAVRWIILGAMLAGMFLFFLGVTYLAYSL